MGVSSAGFILTNIDDALLEGLRCYLLVCGNLGSRKQSGLSKS